MLSRLDAIQDIRLGRGIRVNFVGVEDISGRPHTFSVTVRRGRLGKCEGTIECDAMRGTRQAGPYHLHMTWRQVLTFIRLHYPRFSSGVSVNAQPISFRKAA